MSIYCTSYTSGSGSNENGRERRESNSEEHNAQTDIIRKPIPPPYVPENDPLSRPRQQGQPEVRFINQFMIEG